MSEQSTPLVLASDGRLCNCYDLRINAPHSRGCIRFCETPSSEPGGCGHCQIPWQLCRDLLAQDRGPCCSDCAQYSTHGVRGRNWEVARDGAGIVLTVGRGGGIRAALDEASARELVAALLKALPGGEAVSA